ncbi:50S ribosomal protein L25/general stress protein Ctc [Sulfitobacter sp. M57]|uniref:50S ribosomal protein L25/general stress protein Ctc n=1 Tax=unclassified Sulfitobacter TaxID=196795 RepID=UPI0023E31BE4|nr:MULTISPECIES: 50S ribosomal protein L25/general stress protein Ctc [unclassified Sulfitobacter]MDF3412908.1 50S ribosomal protein L25/general stress protein Ctc [Sulfitobacter sp. KE5]MDF3421808.1 50S ribosomal protein L25/general stress protein Ctc [Sulfitobacter sp. KE43]MDF3431457.1 50S ribosomal protein L25/general stress protein Ctc [Sulfitobacter sp. KE42]MDF3457098.1 50S ribosomal protein L25/general stress protein Ctc [Sulfitobacter sp. S74]MDF3461001.1 50S ribosomal protein L25/gen
MAGEIPDLIAQERTGTGKGAARQARRDGLVPGIVFGGDVDPLPITLDFNKLLTMLRKGRFKSTLFNLKVEGHDDVRVICRDVQRHVVKDLPTHVDFMRLKRTTKINLFINVEVVGEEECVGLKKGGTLNVLRPEIELVVTAADIPESIEIDITALEIGDNLTISDVKLPEGAKPTIDRDFVIAQVSAPSGLASSDDDEEGEDGDAAEAEATE